jgi:signal transduction histidine kinase
MKSKPKPGTGIDARSLTVQLLAVVVIPLSVLLMVITFGSSALHQNAMRELVGERDKRAARTAATAIEDSIQGRAIQIQGLAGQLSYATSAQAEEVLQNASYMGPEFDAGIAVIDGSGEILAAQGNYPDLWRMESKAIQTGLASLAQSPYQASYLSGAFIPTWHDEALMMVLAFSLDRQSAVVGAFWVRPVAERVLANIFSADEENSAALIAQDGAVLYLNGFTSERGTIQKHPGVAEALRGRDGTVYFEADTGEHVAAYTQVDRLGWALVLEEPWEQVASPLLETTHMAPLVLAPVLLLALLAILFGIRQIIQPLQALATQSSRLGGGDYKAIERPVGGISEIQLLQAELIQMAGKLREAHESLHRYIGVITSSQEDERRRLARELHDDTIQSLIAFKQRVQLAEMDWADQPVAQSLKELEIFAEETISNLRRMIRALRPIYLEDLGLVAAINMLADETGKQAGIDVIFEQQGIERRLAPQVELALYRIVQEALNNMTHHASATYAAIHVKFFPESVNIDIQDNGKGFQPPESPNELASAGHFGLLGMYERADLIGGKIRLESKPGRGTHLTVFVPGNGL